MLNLLYLFLLIFANVVIRKAIPHYLRIHAERVQQRRVNSLLFVRCIDHEERLLDVKAFECLYSEQKAKRGDEPLMYAFCVNSKEVQNANE
jgi:hypothetical protein